MQTLSSDGITSPHNFKHTPQIAMTVNPNSLNELLSSPLVKNIHEDKVRTLSLNLTVPQVGADTVFAAGVDGSGQAVAILDTGVDTTHDFFSGGKVVAEACFTANLIGNRDIPCPNNQNSQTGSGSAAPCVDEDDDLFPGCDHGTHVAGIAAGHNVVGTTVPDNGVAKGAKIIAIQVFTVFKCGTPPAFNCFGAFDSDIIDGLSHVMDLHNDVGFTYDISSVNLSLGGGAFTSACDSEPHKLIIDSLRALGIATVIASGNDGFINGIQSPACISTAVSVGSVDEHDVVPFYSNRATFLDLLAPGGNLNSPFSDSPTDTGVSSSVPGNTFAAFTGTSMATPHVTGAWALLKQTNNTASVSAVLHVLKNTGVFILEPFGGILKPRINIDLALDALEHASICGKSVLDFDTFIFGTSGDDTISGTSGNDLIIVYGGDDSVKGNGGDDCLFGGAGADRLSGGMGNDYVNGSSGADDLKGGAGDDFLTGGADSDRLSGGAGDDELHGGAGADSLTGRDGIDALFFRWS